MKLLQKQPKKQFNIEDFKIYDVWGDGKITLEVLALYTYTQM